MRALAAPMGRPITHVAVQLEGFDMTQNDPSSGKEPDKYGGMVDFDLALTPSVVICAAAGAAN